MDWITDQIAIGNFLDAQALTAEVSAVLCLKEGCPCGERDDVDAIQVPLIDGMGNAEADIAEAVDFIREIVNRGDRILVHCHAGRSRSVVVVARYLMERQGITGDEALSMIAVKREIWVTPGLEQVLKTGRRI